ncbi:acyl-CoA dehydrogenase family protein [Cryptosporangium sp. NPDC048952]|uniref:acyl-CoA dehydrogenase family protein n=1 Tax=Cryptosporangium sp. NPDC048952 TaxID=3363961 RepID=UPI0037144843
MDARPTEEHLALAEAVDGLVARRAQTVDPREILETPRGYDETLWRTLCDQIGAAALAIPEEYGGAGYSLAETHVVLERLGAKLVPSPLLGSAVLAAQAILTSADDEACARLLPGIAAGTTLAALAWADTTGHWCPDTSDVVATPTEAATPTAALAARPATVPAAASVTPTLASSAARTAPPEAHRPAWILSGTATLVLDGVDADVVIVAACTAQGVGLFEVHEGIARERTAALDQTLRFATLTFDRTPATALILDAAPVLTHVADVAAVAVTALQVGAAEECLQRTVEHLRTRVQFGRPLGSFQALKHRVAEMFVAVESARSMSWAAARADPAELPLRAALAKAWCSDAFHAVAAETIQLHGGIAITWEHDAHLYFKRAHATAQLFGASREHRCRLLAHV